MQTADSHKSSEGSTPNKGISRAVGSEKAQEISEHSVLLKHKHVQVDIWPPDSLHTDEGKMQTIPTNYDFFGPRLPC